MMTNQGSFGVAVNPAGVGQIGTTGLDLDSTNFATNLRTSASMGMPITAIAHDDGVTARVFKFTATIAANSQASFGFDNLIVYMRGGPATTASLQLRIVAHYELVFSSNSVFNQVATPSAVENTGVTSGSNFVKRTMDQVIVGGTKEFEKRVMNTAELFGRFAVRSAATAVGAYFGGPAGAAVGYSMSGAIMDYD